MDYEVRSRRLVKFHEVTLIVAQLLYGVPHRILRVFDTVLYKNKFQNPAIFPMQVSVSTEQSTLSRPTIRMLYIYRQLFLNPTIF
jgi:hypothetical protein